MTQAQGSATRWTAVIRETANLRAAGLDIGVARSGAQYFVGISRGADVTSQGPVTLSADAAACARCSALAADISVTRCARRERPPELSVPVSTRGALLYRPITHIRRFLQHRVAVVR